jgi:hypothetical protein
MRLHPITLAMLVAIAAAPPARGQDSTGRSTAVRHHVTGPFDVKLGPLTPYNTDPDALLGRMSIDKQFHGALEAASRGEMLSTGSARGSGGYVAMERVTGVLEGRHGSFALQHNATMDAGTPSLNIIVVPGSGTGELAGLSGRMTINIAPGGAHSYDFEYEIAPAAP